MGKLKRRITELDEFSLDETPKETYTNQRISQNKLNFIDNFIYNFTEEDLAAKHTLETIFNKSHSFGYTYKSIRESLQLDSSRIGSFFKALAAVADLKLIELSKSRNVFDFEYEKPALQKVSTTLFDSPTQYETDVNSTTDGFYQQDVKFYELLDMILYNMIKDIEFSIDENTDNSIPGIYWYVNKFEEGVLSYLLPFGSDFFNTLINITKSSSIHNLTKFSQASSVLTDIIKRGNQLITHWIFRILNKSESSHTSLFDDTELKWQDENNRNCIDILNKLFLFTRVFHDDIPNYDAAVDKLKRLEVIENEALENKRRLENEKLKKLQLKRNAVSFILDRRTEYEKLSKFSRMKHPFYIIGQDVKKYDAQLLKKFSKKLKSLLHPDTETDYAWKCKCEDAFKEASSALDRCAEFLGNAGRMFNYINGPLIDFFEAENDLQRSTNSLTQFDYTSQQDLRNNIFNVTYMFFPEFTVDCTDNKTGALVVTLDANTISQKLFSSHTFFNILVHRPIHGDEPLTLIPKTEQLSTWKRVDIQPNVRFNIATIDAVQPLSLGSTKRYYVGVQVGGKTGSSLIKWKTVYIELAKKGRNSTELEKLLETFNGAPFVSDRHAQLSNEIKGNKVRLEKYVNECIEAGQRWADRI